MPEPIIEPAAEDAIVPIMLGPADAAAGGGALCAIAGGGAAGFGAIMGLAAMEGAGRGGAAIDDDERDGPDEVFFERAKPMDLMRVGNGARVKGHRWHDGRSAM